MKTLSQCEKSLKCIFSSYGNCLPTLHTSLVGLWYGARSGVTSATPLWAPYNRPDGCEWVWNFTPYVTIMIMQYVFQISADDLFCSAYWFWTFHGSAADFVTDLYNFICGIYWPNLECNSYCCLGFLPVYKLESAQHLVCSICTKRSKRNWGAPVV